LPAALQSIREHQIKDAHCRTVYEKLKQADPAVRNLKLWNGPHTKTKRYLVPQELRPMVLDYFHDSECPLGRDETSLPHI
jgi:hypothetical protein